tara:strand:+ start:450 stop:563 length:114 start_codon:yes stop_codon:yes gene_type:complete
MVEEKRPGNGAFFLYFTKKAPLGAFLTIRNMIVVFKL